MSLQIYINKKPQGSNLWSNQWLSLIKELKISELILGGYLNSQDLK